MFADEVKRQGDAVFACGLDNDRCLISEAIGGLLDRIQAVNLRIQNQAVVIADLADSVHIDDQLSWPPSLELE